MGRFQDRHGQVQAVVDVISGLAAHPSERALTDNYPNVLYFRFLRRPQNRLPCPKNDLC